MTGRHRSVRSRARHWNRMARLLILGGMLAGIWLVIATAPSAHAAERSVDVPGIEVCPKQAPFAETPDTGLAGLLGERPVQITKDDSPDHIWSTGGFAGLRSHTYDLGCALDPTSWLRITNASTDSKIVNAITGVGDGMVSLTDSVDRRAWSPGWIMSFLGDFAERATGVVNTAILIPIFASAVIVAVVILLLRAHHGDISSSATNVGWIFVVLTITSLLMLSPLIAQQAGQYAGGTAVALLNNGSNPTDAATNQIVKNVQYQGWLRRNFGSVETPSAAVYGPRLLASTRVSWAEMDTINALPSKEQADAREALTQKKAKQFKDIAAKVKDADPTAYRYLTGEQLSSGESLVEVLTSFAGNGIRLAVAILMLTCQIMLVLLAIFWVILTVVLIQPKIGRLDGRSLGMGLINNGIQALGYVLIAALGSWLFGIYLQACMAPGISLWWSLLLLIIGTGIAWVAIGPIAKFKAIVSFGKADGASLIGKLVKTYAMAYIGGRVAGRTIAEADDEEQEPERLSEDVSTPAPSSPQVVQADIYHPAPAFAPDVPTTVDADPLPGRVVEALPSGMPVYERPTGQPDAPPDNAESPYEPYERTDDNEGART